MNKEYKRNRTGAESMNRGSEHRRGGRGTGGRGTGGRGMGGRGTGGRGTGGRGTGVRQKRVLNREELELILLSLVGQKAQHGYELIRSIKILTEGVYAPSPGMVYPTLRALEEKKFSISTEADNGRNTFGITEQGREHLAGQAELLADIEQRLRDLPNNTAQQIAPIERAMANLEMVLDHAVDGAEQSRIYDIVSIIDQAASKIERPPEDNEK